MTTTATLDEEELPLGEEIARLQNACKEAFRGQVRTGKLLHIGRLIRSRPR